MLKVPIAEICVTPDTPLRQAIACLNRGEKGIVLITDESLRLQATVVDGDVRRGLLAGVEMNGPVADLLALKGGGAPVTAPAGSAPARVVELMRLHSIRQVPLVDETGRVIDLVTASDILEEAEPPLEAMVMAGGFGKRLHPLTKDTPKPLLPLGEKPLLSHIIGQLKKAGIARVNLSTHYLGSRIRESLGDGADLGVELNYVDEERPLGTAGALGLLEPSPSPLLIINGDILTEVDFRSMLAFHREHGAQLTVGVRQYDFQVPFGVVEGEGVEVRGIIEKPRYSLFVNAGIYLVEPGVRDLVEAEQHLDMTDLIQRLIDQGRKVVSFPIIEYWLDVGTPEDYRRAQEDMKNGKIGS